MEEEENVESLLCLRQQRSAFTRMVSWEIGQDESKKTIKSVKKKRTVAAYVSDTEDSDTCESDLKNNGDDDNIDDDEEEEEEGSKEDSYNSCESEYYSVEEECVDDSRTRQDGEAEDAAAIFVDTVDTSFDACERKDDVKNQQSVLTADRQKAPSKKQKRKKRQRWKQFAEYALPFRNVEDIDFESLQFEGCDYQLTLRKKVSSLVELCMKTLWKGGHLGKEIVHVPVPLQLGFSEWKAKQQQASAQLSWLYRQLGTEERDRKLTAEDVIRSQKYDGPKVTIATRNVWSCGYEPSVYTSRDLGYIGTEYSSWLPYCHLGNTEYGYNTGFYIWSVGWRCQLGTLSVLSSILDLMLPQSTLTKTESAASADIDVHIKHIERSLHQRYPTVMTDALNVFREAVAYALWVQGRPKQAIEKFIDLAKDAPAFKQARFLCEAARVCSYTGDAESARDLYIKAADSVSGKLLGDPQWTAEVTTQRFLLMADVYDQGVMTEEKTHLAAQAWHAAVKYTQIYPEYSGLRAVESFFCFHSGVHTGTSNRQRLEEGLMLIKSLTEKCPALLHHQAVLQAWLGQKAESQNSLQQFLRMREMIDYGKQDSPLDVVCTSVDLQPLCVVWRTQLGHMRIVTGHQCFEGDFNAAKDLHLHLKADGFLSCDLQMVLPPIRALDLDPYTGVVVFKPMSSVSQVWHSLSALNTTNYAVEPLHYSGKFVVPTLVELYHDTAGNVVHFHGKNNLVIDETNSLSEITLFWMDASGNKSRLRLTNLLRKAQRDYKLKDIQSKVNPKLKTDFGSPEWATWMMKAVEHCWSKGWEMRDHQLKRLVKLMKKVQKLEAEVKKSRKDVKDKKKKAQQQKELLEKNFLSPFKIQFLDYIVYDRTIFMGFAFSDEMELKFFVIIDCSSQATFLEPNIQVVVDSFNSRQTYIPGETICAHHNHHVPHGQIMWIEVFSLDSTEMLCRGFDKRGEVVQDVFIGQASTGTTCQTPLVHGSKLYGISQDKTRVLCNQLTGDEPIHGPELASEIFCLFVLPFHILVHSSNGLHLVNPNTLHTAAIIVRCKKSSLSLSSDGTTLKARGLETVEIIGERSLSDNDGNISYETAVGMYKHLLVIRSSRETYVDVCIAVPGQAKEVCFINRTVGFLVSVSLQKQSHANYRENLYHYNYRGDLLAVLPFLGPGPRNMFPAFLSGSQEPASHDQSPRQPGWYVFLRDGHEGIMGIHLCDE